MIAAGLALAFAGPVTARAADQVAAPKPLAPARVDVVLYMPKDIFQDLHEHARRLDLSDSMLLSACWHAARSRLDSKDGDPELTASTSRALYFSLPAEVHDEAARAAAILDRSKSWVLMKTWNLTRSQVEVIPDREAFMTWLRSIKANPPAKPSAPRP